MRFTCREVIIMMCPFSFCSTHPDETYECTPKDCMLAINVDGKYTCAFAQMGVYSAKLNGFRKVLINTIRKV